LDWKDRRRKGMMEEERMRRGIEEYRRGERRDQYGKE
jgi:hypothetical protein